MNPVASAAFRHEIAVAKELIAKDEFESGFHFLKFWGGALIPAKRSGRL